MSHTDFDTHEPNGIVPEKRVGFYYDDISGPNKFGHSKARILLRYFNMYSDGTEQEFQRIVTEKPILDIFQHGGFVNVRMDFDQSIDRDLRDVWNMLEDYSRPINSVDYTPEEMERGFYTDETGEHMVHFPMIELTISPMGRETEYAISGMNPAFYTLQPRDSKGTACVIQLTFPSDWFSVITSLDVDPDAVFQETAEGQGFEH